MKFILEQSDTCEEVEITVKCGQIDPFLEQLIEQIRLYGFSIVGEKDEKIYKLNVEQIFYFEAVDNRVYAYCEKEVYACKKKLYEIEAQLGLLNFQRISKSCMINIYKLKSVRTLLNGRMEITMENDERLIVSRHYADALREIIYREGER